MRRTRNHRPESFQLLLSEPSSLIPDNTRNAMPPPVGLMWSDEHLLLLTSISRLMPRCRLTQPRISSRARNFTWNIMQSRMFSAWSNRSKTDCCHNYSTYSLWHPNPAQPSSGAMLSCTARGMSDPHRVPNSLKYRLDDKAAQVGSLSC